MRYLRGCAALLVLLFGVVAVPVLLVRLGGNPLPHEVSLATVREALFTRDDGTVLIGLITIVGWLAWLVFVASVAAEMITLLSGRRIRVPLPGLVAPQRLVAGLILTVVAMGAAPLVVHAHPVAAPAAPAEDTPTAPLAGPDARDELPHQDAETTGFDDPDLLRHTVERGDDLWSLAEHYYGHGSDWRKIAAANPSVLSGGPDRLRPGWVLAIPDASVPSDPDARHVVVQEGDTLSSIAEAELGSAAAWPALFKANRAVLSSPDGIDVGIRLVLPGAKADPSGRSDDQQGRTSGQDSPETETADTPESAETQGEPEHQAESEQPSSGAGESGRTGSATEDGPAAEPGRTLQPADPTQRPEAPRAPSEQNDASVPMPLFAAGGLLAAGLAAGVAARRRAQLATRPVGRRILHPTPAAQRVETELNRQARPLSLRTLDRAIRAIAAHSMTTGAPVPALRSATVSDTMIQLVMDDSMAAAPVGFEVSGDRWRLGMDDAHYLRTIPGISEAPRPYPGIVTLGRDKEDTLHLIDLETIGLLPVEGNRQAATGVLRACALELATSPWAQELSLSLVGDSWRLPDSLHAHNVTSFDDVDDLLDRVQGRVREQRDHLNEGQLPRQLRADPDLADAWAPEFLLVDRTLSEAQRERLESLLLDQPRPTVAAMIIGDRTDDGWALQLRDAPSPEQPPMVRVLPKGLELTAQWVDEPTDERLNELLEVTGTEETTPAPWWHHAPAPVPGDVAVLAARTNGWTREESSIVSTEINGVIPDLPERSHPTLRLLGPIDLVGAQGAPPSRAGRQCLEYCAWLLEHPGTTAQEMATALAVAEGTRRSNMSRLRSWLGSREGDSYLPDAYSGSIRLHPCVSSDWDRLKIMSAAGINRVDSETLSGALRLVRGAPLADAAPGQWHWAEELRTDMASVIRDIGVELSNRALDDHDVELARWAASRSLAAAPEDELLICARIRTEHLAGNRSAVERLALQLTSHARTVGLDLEPDTVDLLQRVLEGRQRARLA